MANGDQRTLAIIPARYDSVRFPGKVLATLAGKPLVAHTYERAMQAALVDEACVATDDERVAEALRPYRIPTLMTSRDHPSGTDRIAEVARDQAADFIVNVQGDEPLIDPRTIDAAVQRLLDDPRAMMSTARRLIANPEQAENPNVVKVVCDAAGRALYFSRCPIPYVRTDGPPREHGPVHWQHIGLYVFRRPFLLSYAAMKPTPLELLERLEQLRVLENGHAIAVIDTAYEAIGVDTPEDLERINALLEGRGNPAPEKD